MKEPCQVIGRDNTTPKDLFRPEFAPWRHLTSCVRTFNQFSGASKLSAATVASCGAAAFQCTYIIADSDDDYRDAEHSTLGYN